MSAAVLPTSQRRTIASDEVEHIDLIPLIQRPSDHGEYDEVVPQSEYQSDDEALLPKDKGDVGEIDKWALGCLMLQHLSNTFNTGLYEFAAFLFLIEVYRDTLVPASLVGLFSKCAGLLFSGYIGGLVDTTPRLQLVRLAISAEKSLNAINYGLFLLLFGPLRPYAQDAFHGNGDWTSVVAVWSITGLTVATSSITTLANTGLTVAVERDWVTTIAQGRSAHLTLLNTSIRRIDLFSKLVAPLFVSLLTTWRGYSFASLVLLCMALLSFAAEFWWIEVVYKRFPVLHDQFRHRDHEQREAGGAERRNWRGWLEMEIKDWIEFARLPIFCSSIAIATIYLTTLSYDGTFIAYIKAVRGWDDAFIAAMRGLCVLTGLLGTVVMPILERRIGLERAGAWSIWFEIGCLLPVLLSFFIGTGQYGEKGPAWNSIVLFGGIALSRIGLWSFDLIQLKELQLALDDHPRRNRLTALQISLQNLFDLMKYLVTLLASSPAQFKWTAVVSFVAIVGGGVSYAVYLRSVRGHLVHLGWLRKAI
ncbi:Ferroporti-1 [Papiliotrema laurentii]|uniref:Solute carrier family 40 member n=1 Tax=Papiliotrema laurentii TaxID=5418 RepID=A0AAD9L638_PAPLA|nr:Ferroporti-1 [Papiliotrema laurentii]